MAPQYTGARSTRAATLFLDSEHNDIEALTKGWVSTFKKEWLDGEACAYVIEYHLDEFCWRNAESASEGIAYGLEAVKDMIRNFGVFGPWGKTSARLDDDEQEEDDGCAYDDVDDLEGPKKPSANAKKSTATDTVKETNLGDPSTGKTRWVKPTVQSRKGELLKATHITRFCKSFIGWLWYQYKDRGGDTLRGRGKGKATGRSRTIKKTKRHDDAERQDLSPLLIHELLGLGQSQFHILYTFNQFAAPCDM
ncbi:hypothetical protein BDZ89DRAFT_1142034 [Hymenopellis radicata]|nr:hypothetical protein BDZ89DRAFT_1142034 [Hymenopellis radicata]